MVGSLAKINVQANSSQSSLFKKMLKEFMILCFKISQMVDDIDLSCHKIYNITTSKLDFNELPPR